MATRRERADEELVEKLRLEAELEPQVRRIMKTLAQATTRSFGVNRTLPDLEELTVEGLAPILRDHYDQVAEVFDRRVRGELPEEVEMTEEEALIVAAALSEFYDQRAEDQAREIGRTNQADAEASLSLAELERRRLEDEGDPPGPSGTAFILGTIFGRKMLARSIRIAALETQTSAEAAKQAEVNVLLGEVPGLVQAIGAPAPSPTASPLPSQAIKTWITQGDSRVRPDHLAADGQQVPANEPFSVGGELLMYPGDVSLGASPGNVINCRCSAVQDVGAVAAARR